MAINESVYGARENWIVPSQRTEQGAALTADVYYYDDVAGNDNLKIKIANYNTLATPITRIRSQINGSPQATGDFVVNNNWDVATSDGIDKTICQFGIGSQSGLANQEYWYTYYNDTNVTTLLISDSKDIINVAFGLQNHYRPHVYTNRNYLSNLIPYDNGYAHEQGVSQQSWGEHSEFNVDYSKYYGYLPFSGYADANLITQIPIKNLKISPVIIAYNSNFEPKTFESISGYLAERQTYNKLCCIKIKFRYAKSTINDFNGEVSIHPFFVDDFIGLNGLWGGNTNPYEWSGSKMHWFYRNSDLDGFIVAGRPPYGYDDNYNRIPWYDIYYSTTWSHDSAIGGIVYQTPDFKFTLDANNCFTCDVANMSDDDITEGIRKQLASFGLFFVDDIADINLALDDEKTFLGILENGVGYGKYSHGADNRNQPQWNWDTMEENDYDPENPPTPIMPDNWSDDANSPYSRLRLGLVNNWYILSELIMKTVFEKMTGIDLVTLDKNLTYGLNPIDCIVQAKRIYCVFNAITDSIESQPTTDISFGRLELNIQDSPSTNLIKVNTTMPVSYEVVKSYPVGEPSSYRDFRSYMPFTTCAFYDAFCGIVEIDPAKILNKYITIYQTVDVLSGDKITSLYTSENPDNIGERVATLTGNCSEEIPINGLQAADYIRNKYLLSQQQDIAMWNMVSRSSMGAGGASISGISGNVIGAATQAVGTIANTFIAGNQLETIDYQLSHLTPQVSKVSKGTSNIESGVVFGPTLFLYLPKMNENYDQLLYGNLTGFAGYKVVKPKDLNAGTHIFSHPKVSISGTKNEAYMLVDQLQKGIIIK